MTDAKRKALLTKRVSELSSAENKKADKHGEIARKSPLGWEDPKVRSSATPKGHKQSYYRG